MSGFAWVAVGVAVVLALDVVLVLWLLREVRRAEPVVDVTDDADERAAARARLDDFDRLTGAPW